MTIGRKPGDRQSHMLWLSVPVLFATIACGLASPPTKVGELRTKSESIEVGAESVQVEINMAAGELAVTGGANDLLEADFAYNVDELEPEVKYSDGTLVVTSPEAGIRAAFWRDLDEYRYEWDLRFNNDVPMAMKVDMAAGSADLELGDLSLTSLDIETGASDVKLDLSDSSSLRRLDVEAGLGQATVDLSGNWRDDLDANISTGVGDLTVRLPRNVCVRVDVEGGLSNVETHGLTYDGVAYVNDACGNSETTLRIHISAGVGSVHLEVDE